MGQFDLDLVVEASDHGDHGEGGAAVGRPQRVGAGRPRVDDTDHAVDRGDSSETAYAELGRRWVVGVDAVGDDGDLATGLGQVVEPLGDSSGFGAGACTEAVDSTENAELPKAPAPISNAIQRAMTVRRRRTTREASEEITTSPPRGNERADDEALQEDEEESRRSRTRPIAPRP